MSLLVCSVCSVNSVSKSSIPYLPRDHSLASETATRRLLPQVSSQARIRWLDGDSQQACVSNAKVKTGTLPKPMIASSHAERCAKVSIEIG